MTQFDMWSALKAGNPQLALVPAPPEYLQVVRYENYPGFKDWLVSEYALGWPSKRICEHLAAIRVDQEADMATVWPILNKREVDECRSTYRADWMPLRDQLSANIENVGVLAKNERLLTLARMAAELEDMMFEERNTKTGQLYLLPEWRQIMRQIAEEKGELGETSITGDNVLLELARIMAAGMQVQGSEAPRSDIIEGEFTYYPEEADAATTVLDQSGSVSTDGVQAEPQPDQVPPDSGGHSSVRRVARRKINAPSS